MPRLLFPLCLLFFASACTFDGPLGEYDLEESVVTLVSCSAGVDAELVDTWSTALSEAGLDEMRVTEGPLTDSGPMQAIFRRSSDDSLIFSEIAETESRVYAGERLIEATTVADSGLGSDFAALADPDGTGCSFDLSIAIDLQFETEDWTEASGTVGVVLTETLVPSETHCALQECAASYLFDARHRTRAGGTRIDD